MNLLQTSLPVIVFRLVRVSLHITQGLLTTTLVFPVVSEARREQLKQRWSAQLLHILNIHVRTHGVLPDHEIRGVMFVANHISWLDIFALNAIKPVWFIAKSELRSWPLFGWLAKETGTLFIERNRRHDTGRIARLATQALQDGQCLCFFPEGTTTDGTLLLPFKTSLLQPAIDAGANLWPLAICYPLPDGNANTAIAYWGNMTMLQSVKALLKQHQTEVELRFSPPLPTAGHGRRVLAQQTRQIIAASLNLPEHKAPETLSDPPAAMQ